MVIFVKIVGILILVLSIMGIIYPDAMKKVALFFVEGKRLYIVGVIRIIIGICLLLAASQAKIPIIILILGIIILVAGIFCFLIGPEKMKPKINAIMEKSANIRRLLAVIAFIIGALMVYSA